MRNKAVKVTLKSSGSLPSPHPVHAVTKNLEWPSCKILRPDLKKKVRSTTRGLDVSAF